MTKRSSSIKNKKALIITELNESLYDVFPAITNLKEDELLIINSFGASISQPYGCTIRNIIMAVYYENIENIYIIAEQNSNEQLLSKEELQLKMIEGGISDTAIKTLDYINVVGDDIMNWLIGPEDIRETILKNIEMVEKHPLIPKSVSVYGFIADAKTKEFESVKEKLMEA